MQQLNDASITVFPGKLARVKFECEWFRRKSMRAMRISCHINAHARPFIASCWIRARCMPWQPASEEVAAEPAGVTRSAIESISSYASSWWLHTDLDVLSERYFFARGAPGEISLSGGLTWQQLTEVIQTALRVGGCRGWSLAIYNPDLDPDGSQARQIVQLVTEIAPHLP